MSNAPFVIRPPAAAVGEIPLLVSIPHTGVDVPASIWSRFEGATVRELRDTDWHLHDLWDFVPALGATTIHARFSRYVIDLNRAPDAAPLYPGRDETELVPRSTFDREPIYRAGDEPDATEIADRVERYWRPYHQRLAAELARLVDRFGYAMLFDAHSIRSVVPRFFDGELPLLMLGDANGESAGPSVTARVLAVLESSGLSFGLNDPFRGGYITRRYGSPEQRIHALQLEMSQRAYMDESPPFRYDPQRAAGLQPVLTEILRAFAAAAETAART